MQNNSEIEEKPKVSLKVTNPRARDIDLVAIAPNKVVKVSRPKTEELRFDAGVAALAEREKTKVAEERKVEKLQAFAVASKKRATEAKSSKSVKKSSKVTKTNKSPAKKDIRKALSAVKSSVRAFSKIA